jgi:hypothetical protein
MRRGCSRCKLSWASLRRHPRRTLMHAEETLCVVRFDTQGRLVKITFDMDERLCTLMCLSTTS